MFNLQIMHKILSRQDYAEAGSEVKEQNHSDRTPNNLHANWHLMSPEGARDLRQMLENVDMYKIHIPEHGALLAVA